MFVATSFLGIHQGSESTMVQLRSVWLLSDDVCRVCPIVVPAHYLPSTRAEDIDKSIDDHKIADAKHRA